MRRVMLLALLALALPTAALASSFDFPSGTFMSGTTSGPPANLGTLTVSLVGDMNTVAIVTGTLHALPLSFCPPGSTACFHFAGGTVTVPTEAFTNSLQGGFITRRGNEIAIAATLAPSATVSSGSASFDYHFLGTTLSRGEAGVQGQSAVIPEPGTLSLLGTGVIGLAGLTRRKRKLGT